LGNLRNFIGINQKPEQQRSCFQFKKDKMGDPNEIFSDLVPSKQNSKARRNGGAFAEDAVLASSSLDGTRTSGNNSMPGTPMVSSI
jgi:hypothetical protein